MVFYVWSLTGSKGFNDAADLRGELHRLSDGRARDELGCHAAILHQLSRVQLLDLLHGVVHGNVLVKRLEPPLADTVCGSCPLVCCSVESSGWLSEDTPLLCPARSAQYLCL